MVTRDILYLTIHTFLDVVVKKNSVGWHLFRVVSGNWYLPRGSNENLLYITSTGNVFVAIWVIPLITILSGYHADTPITIKAEAIRKADSCSH